MAEQLQNEKKSSDNWSGTSKTYLAKIIKENRRRYKQQNQNPE